MCFYLFKLMYQLVILKAIFYLVKIYIIRFLEVFKCSVSFKLHSLLIDVISNAKKICVTNKMNK